MKKITKREFNKWLADLRSDRFLQGNHMLLKAVDDEYHLCCLGVLADNVIEADWVDSTGSGVYVLDTGANGHSDDIGYNLINDDVESDCVTWNDNQQLSFKQIANNLEKLGYEKVCERNTEAKGYYP